MSTVITDLAFRVRNGESKVDSVAKLNDKLQRVEIWNILGDGTPRLEATISHPFPLKAKTVGEYFDKIVTKTRLGEYGNLIWDGWVHPKTFKSIDGDH